MQLLGYCKLLCKVHPDLATVPEPLRRLTRKDVPYQWGKEQGKAFNELEKRLANTETQGDFDKDAETRLITWNLFTQGNHTQVQESIGGYYDCSHIAYCFTVRQIPGKENIADTLSHLTDQHTKSCAKLCTEPKSM